MSDPVAEIDLETISPDEFRALRLKQQESRLGDYGQSEGLARLGGGVRRSGGSPFTVQEFDIDDPTLPQDGDERDVFAPEGKQSLSDAVLPSKGCISEDDHRARLVAALEIPGVKPLGELRAEGLGKRLILCGGGASLEQTLPDIRAQLASAYPPKIMAVNKTHDWLISKGIIPDYAVLMDPREHIATYMTPTHGVKYLFGGSVDPSIWDKFKDHDVYLWHAAASVMDHEFLKGLLKVKPWLSIASIPGPSTVGLRSFHIAVDVMEFPSVEMHGFDSCYAPEGGALWAYPKSVTFEHARVDFNLVDPSTGDRLRVEANPDMSRQVYEFDAMVKNMIGSFKSGCRKRLPKMILAGDGAIPWMAWKRNAHATPDRMQAKYGDCAAYDYRNSAPEFAPIVLQAGNV